MQLWGLNGTRWEKQPKEGDSETERATEYCRLIAESLRIAFQKDFRLGQTMHLQLSKCLSWWDFLWRLQTGVRSSKARLMCEPRTPKMSCLLRPLEEHRVLLDELSGGRQCVKQVTIHVLTFDTAATCAANPVTAQWNQILMQHSYWTPPLTWWSSPNGNTGSGIDKSSSYNDLINFVTII